MATKVHPVQLRIDYPPRTQRVHVVTRLLLLLAIAAFGCGAMYWALYLAIPAAASILIGRVGPDRYLAEDAPHAIRVLRWFASAYGYLWLLTDQLPTANAGPVDLQVIPSGSPTVTSALLRVITSIPAIVLLAVLSLLSGIAWVVGAVSILVTERIPPFVADFLTLTLRVQFQLLAYHLSLVDRYPSLRSAGIDHPAA